MPDLDFCETSIIIYVLNNKRLFENKKKVNISDDLKSMINSFIEDLSYLCSEDEEKNLEYSS